MNRFSVILTVLCAIGFVSGLIYLFHLRFQAGDNYPRYSSLRADPLGTKALFESLDPIVDVKRNFLSINQLGDGRDSTFLYLGAGPTALDLQPQQLNVLERFVRTGGRLVISLRPPSNPFQSLLSASSSPARTRATPATNTNQPAPPPPARKRRAQLSPAFSASGDRPSMEDQWGFRIDSTRHLEEDMSAHRTVNDLLDAVGALPPALSLHSPYWFDQLDPAWRLLYFRQSETNQYPVMIERSMGKGMVILAADSFPFSNEALRFDRHPTLLTYVIGESGQIFFDETHLGTKREPGMAALARRYRLGGVVLAVALLAGLFIWKNTAVFLPPHAEELALEQKNVVVGKDSASGFVNLLRRNIAPTDVLAVCLEQWNLHSADDRRPSRVKLEEMQRIIDAENNLEPKHRHPTKTYRQFCDILSRKD